MSLKEHFNYQSWNLWPEDIRNYQKAAIRKYRKELKKQILFWEYVQYEYYTQLAAFKEYANQNNVRLIGDMPFYVEYDSVDVWSNRQIFSINKQTNDIDLYVKKYGKIFENEKNMYDYLNALRYWEWHNLKNQFKQKYLKNEDSVKNMDKFFKLMEAEEIK